MSRITDETGIPIDETRKTKEQQIKEIVDNFDWAKVHKVMEALNWTWRDSEDIPTIGELVTNASQLMSDVWDKQGKAFSISSGGFVATFDDGCLGLTFEVESYFSEGIE